MCAFHSVWCIFRLGCLLYAATLVWNWDFSQSSTHTLSAFKLLCLLLINMLSSAVVFFHCSQINTSQLNAIKPSCVIKITESTILLLRIWASELHLLHHLSVKQCGHDCRILLLFCWKTTHYMFMCKKHFSLDFRGSQATTSVSHWLLIDRWLYPCVNWYQFTWDNSQIWNQAFLFSFFFLFLEHHPHFLLLYPHHEFPSGTLSHHISALKRIQIFVSGTSQILRLHC